MRCSAFIISGVALVSTTVIGGAWWLADDGVSAFGLGVAGAVAVGTGWAGNGRTVLRGAGRAALVAASLFAAVASALAWILATDFSGGFFLPIEVYRRTQDDGRPSLSDFADFGLSAIVAVAVVATVAAVFGACARLYAGLPRRRWIRLLPAAAALLPILLESAVAAEDGIGAWFVVCVLAEGWLIWAMRRARTVKLAAGRAGASDPLWASVVS